MITDKEYPATHSMSTSWFGIDKEGNVAIFDFDENGPVPGGLPEESIESVITDHLAHGEGDFRCLRLTCGQAKEFLNRLKPVSSADDCDFDCLVKINPEYSERFQNVLRMNKDRNSTSPIILNEELGLYFVDFYDWDKTSLKELIDEGVIERFEHFDIEKNDSWSEEKGKWVFASDYDSLPFFMYNEAYNPFQLIERSHVPLIPFKEEQMSPYARSCAMHFDISFKDTEALQIAEILPYDTQGYWEDDNPFKTWLPISNNEEALIDEYTFPVPYCGKSCKKCKFCDGKTHLSNKYAQQRIDYPTLVCVFMGRWFQELRSLYAYNPFHNNIASIPLIFGYPWDWEDHNKQMDIPSEEEIREIFANCQPHLEDILDFLKPYAIITTDTARKFLEETYNVCEGKITIADTVYPFFYYSEINKHRKELEELSKLPYRGKKRSRIIEKRPIKND